MVKIILSYIKYRKEWIIIKIVGVVVLTNAEATQSATLCMLCTLCSLRSLHQVATLAAIRTRHVTCTR